LGFEVVKIKTDREGVVDIESLVEAVDDNTILVSVMYVNNEVGSVMPAEEIGRRIKEKNPQVVFHVDAIQAFGKYRIYPGRMGIDLMSISSHKFHGPKGVGALYAKERVKLKPIIYGGGQQSGMRSGTENVPGIAGMALAAKMVYANLDENVKHMNNLKERLVRRMTEIEGVHYNKGEAPHIVSLTFDGVRSEVLLHALEEREIYVSSGSACSSNKHSESATLKTIGLDKNALDSTLRFSFSEDNTEEQIDYAVDCVKEILPMLRRFTRKK
jgi:cysteine desulfurase